MTRIRSWFGARVGQSFTAAVLAVTFTGLVQPSHLIRDAWNDVGGWFGSGSSQAERQVGNVYSEFRNPVSFWERPPVSSTASRKLLVDNWGELTPYRVHPFTGSGADAVTIQDLYENYSIDGRTVALIGYVTQLTTYPSATTPGAVFQRYRLEVGGTDRAAWCRTTLQQDQALRSNERVRVIGVPIARGSASLSAGGFQNGTELVCPSVERSTRPLPSKGGVDSLYASEASSSFWESRPTLSEASRSVLEDEWVQLNPFAPHAEFGLTARRVTNDRLFEDYDLDGKPVSVAGYVDEIMGTEHVSGRPGHITQRYGISTRNTNREVWCISTIPTASRLQANDFVTAFGMLFARGSASLTSGGFDNGSYLVCPVVQQGDVR